jgi:bla regulator protein blaR1
MSAMELSPFANHLWQSTLFAAAAILLTMALKKNHARTRYWLWLAASVKFLIPFSLLVEIGSRFQWRSAPALAPKLSAAMDQISQPFVIETEWALSPQAPFPVVPALLLTIWVCGFAGVLFYWWTRWMRLHRIVKTGVRLDGGRAVDLLAKLQRIAGVRKPTAMVSVNAPALEPGVIGLRRPILLLPAEIADRLGDAQLEAILAHEVCHVRRRDNLTAAIHMVVEAIFWFYPLVWWIGARMVKDREQACDEEVLRMGSDPQTYAEGILNVCKFYLQSPLACAAGVTGSDLRKRIEVIMSNPISRRLTPASKLLLACAGVIALAGPLAIGILNTPKSHAQSQAAAAGDLKFEVASIKPSGPNGRNVTLQFQPGGGLNIQGMPLKGLIASAYNMQCGKNCNNFISGGPGWIDSTSFDIVAKAPSGAEPGSDPREMSAAQRNVVFNRTRQRLRALLAERFQLTIRQEMKEMPVYALVVAKNGHKLKESTKGGESGSVRGERGVMIAENTPISMLLVNLQGISGRTVLDRTGLTGRYDFRLEYTPDSGGGAKGPADAEKVEAVAGDSGPSIFTALQEQLGLRLEATRGPVETIVIERVEKPSEN